jgi:hypothetical protein
VKIRCRLVDDTKEAGQAFLAVGFGGGAFLKGHARNGAAEGALDKGTPLGEDPVLRLGQANDRGGVSALS